jgi:hypothetical protein
MAEKVAIYGRLRVRGLPWIPAFAGRTRLLNQSIAQSVGTRPLARTMPT